MSHWRHRRDNNESGLVRLAEQLGSLWISAPPFDGWLYGRNACRCGAHGWRLMEVKRPDKEGWASEFTPAQLLLIQKLSSRQIPWYPLRTEDDVYALLGARRSA